MAHTCKKKIFGHSAKNNTAALSHFSIYNPIHEPCLLIGGWREVKSIFFNSVLFVITKDDKEMRMSV